MRRALLSALLLATPLAAACAGPSAEQPGARAPHGDAPPRRSRHDEDLGPMLPPVQQQDVVVGTGPAAKKGDRVLVHYRGTLRDGTEFDASYERGSPLEFVIGGGTVIAGWEIGVTGMRKGGRRKLVIPPHLGYGLAGSPPKIGPDATLFFDVELVEIEP